MEKCSLRHIRSRFSPSQGLGFSGGLWGSEVAQGIPVALGVGAWTLPQTERLEGLDLLLAPWQFWGQRRSPVLAARSSGGLGPAAGVEVGKVVLHPLLSGPKFPHLPRHAQLGMPRGLTFWVLCLLALYRPDVFQPWSPVTAFSPGTPLSVLSL